MFLEMVTLEEKIMVNLTSPVPSEISPLTIKPDIRTKCEGGKELVASDKSSGLPVALVLHRRAGAIEREMSACVMEYEEAADLVECSTRMATQAMSLLIIPFAWGTPTHELAECFTPYWCFGFDSDECSTIISMTMTNARHFASKAYLQ